jgi:hypothetical protein
MNRKSLFDPRRTSPERKFTVNWSHYIACFFAGAFLTNVVPHFVQGISGNRFPTPFANPPGKGLSSPTVNVVWALVNLIAGYFLFLHGRVATNDLPSIVVFFAGIAILSIMSSVSFQKKHAS